MLTIKIKGGYSNFKGGRTTVELNSNGEIKIENEYKGKKQHINVHISVDEKLGLMISALVPIIKDRKNTIRKGVPDETFYEIEIIDAERKDANMKFGIWRNRPEIGTGNWRNYKIHEGPGKAGYTSESDFIKFRTNSFLIQRSR